MGDTEKHATENPAAEKHAKNGKKWILTENPTFENVVKESARYYLW